MKLCLAVLAAAWLAACAVAEPLPPDDGVPREHTVSVVSNGWHTAIVAPREEIAATGLLPETADFAGAAFLEFGWGDREYYPARKATLAMTLRAALTSTPSVMRLAGRTRAPQPGPGREVVRVGLTETAFRSLIDAIAGEFERPAARRTAPVTPGLYANSYFYDARGTFHLFNTCNTWTARMLRAAGVDISPTGVVTANDLMTRLHEALGA